MLYRQYVATMARLGIMGRVENKDVVLTSTSFMVEYLLYISTPSTFENETTKATWNDGRCGQGRAVKVGFSTLVLSYTGPQFVGRVHHESSD